MKIDLKTKKIGIWKEAKEYIDNNGGCGVIYLEDPNDRYNYSVAIPEDPKFLRHVYETIGVEPWWWYVSTIKNGHNIDWEYLKNYDPKVEEVGDDYIIFDDKVKIVKEDNNLKIEISLWGSIDNTPVINDFSGYDYTKIPVVTEKHIEIAHKTFEK